MLYRCLLAIFLFSFLCISALTGKTLPPLQTVPRVDMQRYMGTWYEIASFPQRFQKGCVATRATYSLREDGMVDVLNECRRNSLNGAWRKVQGRARIVDGSTNSKLEVSFVGPLLGDFWLFWGQYWILDLGKNYEYAVVGHPSRKYLWILSRKPFLLNHKLYDQILDRLQKQGYQLENLKPTIQPLSPATL